MHASSRGDLCVYVKRAFPCLPVDAPDSIFPGLLQLEMIISRAAGITLSRARLVREILCERALVRSANYYEGV